MNTYQSLRELLVLTSLALCSLILSVVSSAQRRIPPPQELDADARALLAQYYFPPLPDSILQASWDTIYARLDKYTFIKGNKVDAPILRSSDAPKYRPRFGTIMLGGHVEGVVVPSPAFAAGVCAGDRLLRINGILINDNDSTRDAVLSGIPWTDSAVFEFDRGGHTFIRTMLRGKVGKENVFARKSSRTLFIRINMFDDGSDDEFARTVGALGYEGVDSVIIDVRHNPGGDVRETAQILEWFCPKGDTLFASYGKDRRPSTYYVSSIPWHPLRQVSNVIVLVDSSSASAAEAFAGCLKVRRNATVLGTHTFGKGIMQSTHMLGIFSGYSFQMTTAEFFAGGRMKIHKVGVRPDGPVPAWLQCSFDPVPFGREMDVAAFRQQHPRPTQELIRSMNLTADEAFCLWGDDGVLCTYERPNPLAGK